METKKLSLRMNKELIKEFKILSINLDITMTRLLEKAMEDMIAKKKKKENEFTKFGQHSMETIPIQKITREQREDIKTVNAVLPIKDLREV